MRVLKVLAAAIGSLLGGALPVILVTVYVKTVGKPADPSGLGLFLGIAIPAGFVGGSVVVGLVWDYTFGGRYRPPSGPVLTPEAEKDARAKFMPNSDQHD